MPDLRAQLQSTLGAAYAIDRELDGGGMSRVFVAEEVALSRRVVVKVLPPDVAGTVNIDRFKREIQLAARLQHAHIVPVLTAGESNGVPYYTMPFVDGRSLRERLTESGAFPIKEAVSTLRDVARALAYAHEHGVVHRDIKPDNVLVSGGSAMVTDFGIAKAISESRSIAPQPALTQAGLAVGTPSYMSPEQAAGDPLSNHRADIYSFGCLAYELLAGRPPFVNTPPQKLLASHRGEAPTPIADLRPETPRALANLVTRALEKDPDVRPQTAGDLLAVLDDAASTGTPVVTSEPILLPEPRAFAKALLFYVAAFVVVVGLAKGANLLGAPDWVVTWAAIVMALGLPTVLATGFAHHATRRILTATPTTTGGTQTRTRGRMQSLAIEAGQHLTWRRTTLGGVTAIAALVLVTATLMLMGRAGAGPLKSVFSTGALKRTDQIMIGPVTVTNADSSLGPVIGLGVRTQLADSKVIRLVSEASVNRTQSLMRLGAGDKVTASVARDVARRLGAKAVLGATLTGAGPGRFIISLELVSSDSGRQLTAVQAPTSADGLIDAITSLSRQMRARIGESLRTVNETPPFAEVTTSSLEALRAYTAGRQALLRRDDERALALLQTAVKLDSTFATAWRSLRAAIQNNGGRFRDQYDAMEHAHRYADRLPPAERELIEEEYYYSNRLDRAAALRLRERFLLTGGDTVNIGNTAGRYASRRDFATAEALLRAEVSHDSGFALVIHRGTLAAVLIDEGKLAAADSFWAEWRQHVPGMWPNLDLTYNSRGIAAYRRQLDSLAKAHPDQTSGLVGNLALMEGRVAAWARSPDARPASNSAAPALDSVFNRVWPIAVILEHPDRALRELDSAAAKVSLSSIWAYERPDWQLAIAYAQAGSPTRAEKILADFEHQLSDTSLIRFLQPFLHRARAEILLAEHKPLDAIKEFRASDLATDGPFNDCVICQAARMGRAFAQAGMADSAIASFQIYMTTPYSERTSRPQDPSQLALISERLAQLYEGKGDRVNAATYYGKFIDLWKNADPELQPRVAAARVRLARLADSDKPR